ncbi:MAG: GNAT family N-acetyltransferase [Nitrososphaerales archaeon]
MSTGRTFRSATADDQDDGRFRRCPNADYVLEGNGEVVDHGLVSPVPAEFTIINMQTRPGFERKGHGRYFVTELEKLAIRGGASKIYAYDVGADSEGFWKKLGYSLDHKIVPAGVEVEIWSKSLSAHTSPGTTRTVR